jgi:hypothetical protein
VSRGHAEPRDRAADVPAADEANRHHAPATRPGRRSFRDVMVELRRNHGWKQ